MLKDKEEKKKKKNICCVCVLLAAAAGCVKIRADRDSRDGHSRETTNYQSRDSFSRRVKTINKKGKRRRKKPFASSSSSSPVPRKSLGAPAVPYFFSFVFFHLLLVYDDDHLATADHQTLYILYSL